MSGKVLSIVGMLALLMAWLPAQVTIGGKAPAPHWSGWQQGGPVSFANDEAPAATIYAFYASPAHAAQFTSDGGYLAELRRRFAARGLEVVAVVGGDPDGAEVWPGCAIATDAEGVIQAAWLPVAEPNANLVLCARDGTVQFVGVAEAGLVDTVERVLAGKADGSLETRLHAERGSLVESFDDLEGAPAAARLETLLAAAPHDGVAFGLLYLAQATKASDHDAAKRVLQRAVERLGAEARPLAAFADLALRGDPRRDALAQALLPSLRIAAKANAHDVPVQLACLRALVQVGDGREVARAAIRLRRLVMSSAPACLELATILTQDDDAPVHRDLATMVIDQAARLGVSSRWLTAARYGVAVRCADDATAAAKLLDDYLVDTERVVINNDCWHLMTQPSTMGRFDAFAAGLAERMLRQSDAMDYFEFDTAALAMFLAGRNDEAVRLQAIAVQRGGGGNREYLERLERYKVAAQPAPR